MNEEQEFEQLRNVALQNAKTIRQARQQTEDMLRKQSQWLRTTLASIGDAVISTDAECHVTFMNGVAEKPQGWPQAEAMGQALTNIFHIVNEHTREPVENPAERATREGTVVALANHTVLIARDGTEKPIDDSAAAIRDEEGQTVGAVLVFRDVTERKKAEETQARLAAIVASSDDAIISKSLDGVIRSWNVGAERLFGYTPEEAIGQSITLIIPHERFDEERQILARISRGERVDHFETVRVSKSGRLIDLSLTVSPVRNSAGLIIGASKVARDISARKRAEESQRESDRRKDEFIALLAHELRNPLAPLRNGLQVIRLAGDDPAAVAEARAIIDRQLGHMVRLVDDLLDISRISQNKLELRRSRVLLSDVVNIAVETARPTIEEAGHEFSIALPADPVYLDADVTRLAQVLSNLLTNSAKYTEPGGRIWLAAERHDGKVIVSVRDNGIGIPGESLPRIFDMFSQVDRTINRATGGMGIGLALVKQLVEMHEGSVTAESPGPGQGSVFTVELPMLGAAERPSHGAPAESGPAPDGAKRRVLVVDDNRDSALSMAMMLKLMGNDTRVAHDGLEALEMAETFRPDAILMDLGMPNLNGYDATRRLREQPWGRGMIIIALTGWGQDMDRARSKEVGCDGHLVKPVTLPDLEKLLTDLEQTTASRRGLSS